MSQRRPKEKWWTHKAFQKHFFPLFIPYFVILTLGSLGVYFYFSVYHKQGLQDQVLEQVKLQRLAIAKDLTMMVSDLIYLSNQKDLKQLLQDPTSGHSQQVREELKTFLKAKSIYGGLALFRPGQESAVFSLHLSLSGQIDSTTEPPQLGQDGQPVLPYVYSLAPGSILLGGKMGPGSSLYFDAPLFDQGQVVGALALYYSHRLLASDLSTHMADLPGRFVLLDRKGNPLVFVGTDQRSAIPKRLTQEIPKMSDMPSQYWLGNDLITQGTLQISELVGQEHLSEAPKEALETLRLVSFIDHAEVHHAVGNSEDYVWLFWLLATDGLVYVCFLLARGRTLQDRAWSELEDQRRLTSQMLDSVPVAIFLKDLQGRYQLCNHEMAAFLGATPEEVVGKRPDELLPAAEAQAILKSDQAALVSGHTELEEFPIYRQGQRMDLIVGKRMVTPRHDEESQILGFVLDISAQKQAERQANRLRQAVEQSPASLIITDPDGIIEYVNPAFTRITGYQLEEAQGKTPRILKSGEMPLENYQQLWHQITSGRVWQGEFHNRRKDGSSYWAIASISPVLSESGELLNFLGIQEDITERKQQARELFSAKQTAEAANRAKSDFLANMSHEIRTPLNAVLGYTEILDGLIDDPRQRGYLNSVKSAGKGLLTLINDILDLSKIEAGKMRLESTPTHLSDLIGEVVSVFQLSSEQKGLRLVKLVDRRLPEALLLDEIRLRQILVNLIGNAIKFTEAGEIRILAAPERNSDGETVDLTIRIEDTGVGIVPEALQSIFDDFTQQEGQSTKKYGGTGLGLAISQKLVQMMGGEISVVSQLGQGSAFTVHLPGIKLVQGGRSLASSLAPAPQKFVAARLLLVEDNLEIRELIAEFFRDSGLLLETAVDGIEALEKIEAQKPDLILTDIKMPRLDGRKLMARLKGDPRWASIPVVAVTASNLGAPEEDLSHLGFAGILLKPVDRDRLAREIARFVDPLPDQVTAPEAAAEQSELDPAAFGRLGVLVEQLEGPLMARYVQVESNKLFGEIETFGALLEGLGQQFSVEPLARLGRQMLDQAKSFDLAGIQLSLNAYPKLVRGLRSFL
ncbi:MAG: PAS domain S-box protein [bacterium]|nr:PAS domain S-box protein [bacterium]